MTIKQKPRRTNKPKKKVKQNTTRLFKSYRSKIDRRKKHLENLIFVADRWGFGGIWSSDISIGYKLEKKPDTIAKYRGELGIKQGSRDQAKIDAVKEEYDRLVKADKRENGKRLEASRNACKEIKTKYRKKEAKLEKFVMSDGKTRKDNRDKMRSLVLEITELARQLKKCKDKSDRKYNDQILRDLGLIP